MPASTADRGRISRMSTATAISISSRTSAAAIFTTCATTTCRACKARTDDGAYRSPAATPRRRCSVRSRAARTGASATACASGSTGRASGDAIRFQLHDNRAPDAGPGFLAPRLERRVQRPGGPEARLAQLDPRDRRRHGERHSRLGQRASSSTTPTTRRTPRPTAAGNSPSPRASRTARCPATTDRASSPPRG